MSKKQLGIILTTISGIGFALASIFMRALNTKTSLEPIQIAIARFIISFPLFLLIVPKKSTTKINSKLRIKFIVLGFVFSIASFSAIFALNYLPSSTYVIIISLYPAVVALYSLIRKQSLPKFTWLGLPLSIIGLLLTTLPTKVQGYYSGIGIIIALINGIAIAAYFILSSIYFSGVENRLIGTAWMLTGAFIVSLVALSFNMSDLLNLLTGSLQQWLLLIGLGTLGTVMPIVSANIGIQLIGPARASVMNSIQPVVTIFLGILLFGEKLLILQWVGAVLMLGSIIFLQRSPDKQVSE